MFRTYVSNMLPMISHKRLEHPDQQIFYNHMHSDCEIILFISCAGTYNVNGQIFTPRPFDLLFIPSATYHHMIPDISHPYENYVFQIDPQFIGTHRYRRLFCAPMMLNAANDPALLDFFLRLDTYAEAYSEADFAECAEAVIQELLIYCFYRKDLLNAMSDAPTDHVAKVVAYIGEHLEEPLDAEALAQNCLLSKSHIQNLFSSTMHMGLKKYITQKKLYAAHADLCRGMSPLAVSQKYCFGDYSGFYRHYKKLFGTSPKEPKQQMQVESE